MTPTTQVLIGVALMAGGGAQVATLLDRGTWGHAALVCFAVGIIAISTAAGRRLRDRVAQLERDLATVRATD
jgi:hypothetical protein